MMTRTNCDLRQMCQPFFVLLLDESNAGTDNDLAARSDGYG